MNTELILNWEKVFWKGISWREILDVVTDLIQNISPFTEMCD